MNTPWGDLPVADAHVHFFSRVFFETLAAQKPGLPAGDIPALLGWEPVEASPETLADRWAGELDKHGVDKAALIASVPGDEGSVAVAVARHPDRFFGYFMCNPMAPDECTNVSRAIRSGMQGVCFFPAMQRYSMHEPVVLEILKVVASQPGSIAFVHCGVLSVGVRKKLGLTSNFDLRYSNPIDLHSIALQFPGVPFVIPHFGAGYLREALMLCDLCPNVYLDTSSSNGWLKYLPEEITLSSVFTRALEVAGPRRLLFGTDSSFFPRGWHAKIFQTQVEVLREIGTTEETARLILAGNLARILQKPQVR